MDVKMKRGSGDGPRRSRSPNTSQRKIVDTRADWIAETRADPPKPGPKMVGPADGDMGFVLVKHACIVAALASRLPDDADVSPEALRRSMDRYLNAARTRVKNLSEMAPEHAVSAITQLFVFEGMHDREGQEQMEAKARRENLQQLESRSKELERKLKERMAEVQLLREAVLEVQTNANKQVLDARSQQRACERELSRQTAELAKQTKYADHLKKQLDAAESRHARQYLDGSNTAVGGSAGVALLLRRAASNVDGGRQRDGESDEEVEDVDLDAERTTSAEGSPMSSPTTSFRPPTRIKSSATVRGIKVGFSDDASPLPESLSSAAFSPADTSTSAFGRAASFTGKGVPSESQVEAVYLQLGGSKDRAAQIPVASVMRHLEKTYDDLGDPHRFSRIVGKKARFTFDEFALVVLQVSRL